MRRSLSIITAIFLLSASLGAQSRGDMYVSGSLSAGWGNTSTEVGRAGSTRVTSAPQGLDLGLSLGFAYFVADNLRLSLSAEIPFSSTPSVQNSGTWYNTTGIAPVFGGDVAYYFKLCDRLWYTPTLGAGYCIGSLTVPLNAEDSYTTRVSGYTIHGTLLAFEARISNKIALGLEVGGVRYSNTRVYNQDSTDQFVGTGDLTFGLNADTSLSVRYYF